LDNQNYINNESFITKIINKLGILEMDYLAAELTRHQMGISLLRWSASEY